MRRYPRIDELLEKAEHDGKILLEVHRSLISIVSHMFACFLTAALVALVIFFFPYIRTPEWIPLLGGLGPRWLAIIPAFFLIEMLRKYHDDLYVFGKYRVTHLSGRLSLNYAIPVIRYADIRGITVHQDLFGRILNYGNIELETAAQDDAELKIIGVRSPRQLAGLVDDLRLNTRKQSLRKQVDKQFETAIDHEEDKERKLLEALAEKKFPLKTPSNVVPEK